MSEVQAVGNSARTELCRLCFERGRNSYVRLTPIRISKESPLSYLRQRDWQQNRAMAILHHVYDLRLLRTCQEQRAVALLALVPRRPGAVAVSLPAADIFEVMCKASAPVCGSARQRAPRAFNVSRGSHARVCCLNRRERGL